MNYLLNDIKWDDNTQILSDKMYNIENDEKSLLSKFPFTPASLLLCVSLSFHIELYTAGINRNNLKSKGVV